ncbi:hypothetical protein GCM10011409_11840 [Lentibacillus populi]|uniref:Uncharacterized protein n=1 Tax=Lentibacillus populi TaxID=1827502 RepID=A0A9W5X4Q8_9BACI|nr:hypothetical protein [Lentibacillus populi]MBT2217637.1 hypothetical protein [Virgibacillus dakarensis]GGB36055.1 hypothetical protein GCM10011409_11840 [Lentibacillus populi]
MIQMAKQIGLAPEEVRKFIRGHKTNVEKISIGGSLQNETISSGYDN